MNSISPLTPDLFTHFENPVDGISLPEKLNFPFYYEPHPLAVLAASELQNHLTNQTEWNHNFGIDDSKNGLIIGKMFGVLVVKNEQGELGYLSAFSGKLAGQNHHDKFVPPVFDILKIDGFFRKGESIVNSINQKIEDLEKDPKRIELLSKLKTEKDLSVVAIEEKRLQNRLAKQKRKELRVEAEKVETNENYDQLLLFLGKESVKQHYELKDLIKFWNTRISLIQEEYDLLLHEINTLKDERKALSGSIQNQIFDHYTFLNYLGETKDLNEIFQAKSEISPPAGSGECAAPKLLQYAFLNNLKPITMAEFWWGKSPDAEIRKHGHFYPACRGKCEPILGHMLQGLDVELNPMLINPALGKQIETVYEDEYLLAINKPAEFLSVPGTNIQDSVFDRMKLKYPDAKGPLVVHRLDMSTSGIMLIAKSKEVHKNLQRQFINRNIKKQYIALIKGDLIENEGIIELPLRVDLDNRPQQMVCSEFGKRAITNWKVLERNEDHIRVLFSPITGRTHQLRVHAAHSLGLNAPIIGDDLYGHRADRLYLHAQSIQFRHPITKEVKIITIEAPF